MSSKRQSGLVAGSIVALLFTTAPLAVAASSGSVSAPAHATIGEKVTVWVSGKTATDIASGAGVALELQPTANRGGNGIAASPKFSAYVVGHRVEITFRWPPFVNSCFGASQCVNTPWHIGSRADVDVCAQSPDGEFDGCAMTTVLVSSPAQRSGLAWARAPALASMLLTVAQMPTGWSVDSSTGSGVGCLGHTLEPSGIKQTASAAVTFDDNGSLPQVEEKGLLAVGW